MQLEIRDGNRVIEISQMCKRCLPRGTSGGTAAIGCVHCVVYLDLMSHMPRNCGASMYDVRVIADL